MSSRLGWSTAQPGQHRAPVQRPPGQLVQRRGRLGRFHGDRATAAGHGRQRQVAGRAPGRQREPDAGLGVVPAADGGWCPLGHDLAGRDHRHPVGQRLRLVHVVRGEQDRGARRAQAADQLPGVPARARVEPGRRLVQEQQVRATDQAQREIQPPLLPAGQAAHLLPGLPGQPDQADHLADRPRRRVVTGVAGDGLPDGQVRLDRDVLQHQPDVLAQRPAGRPVARVVPEHVDLAGVPGPEPFENFQGGGLARAVRPEQREDLAVGDGEAHPAHRGHRAVALAQPGHGDRGRPPRPGHDGAVHCAQPRTHRASTDRSR